MRTIGGIRIPDKDTYKIQSSFRYDDFQFIEGNRDVDHDDKIEKSIRSSGLLVQPILVNENMQIIEGQNRFTACKNLCLPIYYVVQEGLGLGEVKDLNSASKNWTTKNFIHSYAAGDRNVDYIYVEQLMKAYPWATQMILAFAVSGRSGAGSNYKDFKKGKFKCSEAEYNEAVKILDYAGCFKEELSGIGGRKEYYYIAVMFCYLCEDIDNEYLLQKFKKYYKALSPIADIKSAILQIESKVYNYQMRSPREPISIVMEYERYKRSSRSRKED